MTPREAITKTIRGEAKGGKPVFMPYENKVVPGKALDRLLERGMGILVRVPVFVSRNGKVDRKERVEKHGGCEHIITTVETPVGRIQSTVIRNELTDYISEHFIKSPDD
ncbi:MAG: hypothetical protein FWE62_03065, partial [Firmicutes bacterium]|nr:hypothetical protein [Bacillota bacterium]